MSEQTHKQEQLVPIYVSVNSKNGQPSIRLAKEITSSDLIKIILQAAYHGRPLTIMPQFSNKMQTINTAIEKGILFFDGETYRFAI